MNKMKRLRDYSYYDWKWWEFRLGITIDFNASYIEWHLLFLRGFIVW